VVMWYSTAGVRGSDPIHRRGPTSTFPFVSFLYIYIYKRTFIKWPVPWNPVQFPP
jgi:hypothetical protein